MLNLHHASGAEIQRLTSQGELLFDYRSRFRVWRKDRQWLCHDSLSPGTAKLLDGHSISQQASFSRHALYAALVPPCIASHPLPVKDLPITEEDNHFWQYPALTERRAYENHARLQRSEASADRGNRVHTYLGLPWATYIDRKRIPDEVKRLFGLRVHGYHSLAGYWGIELAVHTVCQHTHWYRLLPRWAEMEVTDIHLSHCETQRSAAQAAEFGIRVHSWPLVPVNMIHQERRKGLEFGKPIADKCFLASFIGAHMPHYRSEVRLRLREEAIWDGGGDLRVEVGDEWHFNALVFQQQVQGIPLSQAQTSVEQSATLIYNQTLSDSVFSLCPEGAGPNTLRLWESLAVGAIPVVIVDGWQWPEPPGEGLSWEDCVLRVGRDEMGGLFDRLRRMRREQPERLAAMQSAGMNLHQRFMGLRCF